MRGALEVEADTVAIGLVEAETRNRESLPPAAAGLVDSGEARSELGRVVVAHDGAKRVIVVGLGPASELDAERARVGAAAAQMRATELGSKSLCWELPAGAGAEVAKGLVQGTLLRAYRFTRYKPDETPGLEQLIVSSDLELEGAVGEAG